MSGLALLAPFAAIGVAALVSIAVTLRSALPAILHLRSEFALCPENREYSFRITEVMARRDDGKVVALPIRQRPVARAADDLRAAA